jgi:hypothetical protein
MRVYFVVVSWVMSEEEKIRNDVRQVLSSGVRRPTDPRDYRVFVT